MAVAAGHVVVDETRGLHEGVDNRWPTEAKAAGFEILRHPFSERRGGRYLRAGAKPVLHRPAVDEGPQIVREGLLLLDCEEASCIGYARLDLGAVADNSRIIYQRANFLRVIACH